MAELISSFHENGYKFLTYVNPFIVDPETVRPEDDPSRFEERFDLINDMRLFVKKRNGETYGVDGWTGEAVQGGQRSAVDARIGKPPVYSFGQDREDLRNWQSLAYATADR